jgi:hypothetical protein
MSTVEAPVLPRLKKKYREEIIPALTEEFSYTNPHQVPGLVKVVVNTGVGEAAKESKAIEGAIEDLTLITGQKPIVTKARKSIAQFKLREGMPIGAHVTVWSTSPCLEFVTSGGCLTVSLTETATTRLVSPNRSCSTRSTPTRLTGCVVLISPSSPRPRPMMRAARCFVHWASPSSPHRKRPNGPTRKGRPRCTGSRNQLKNRKKQ